MPVTTPPHTVQVAVNTPNRSGGRPARLHQPPAACARHAGARAPTARGAGRGVGRVGPRPGTYPHQLRAVAGCWKAWPAGRPWRRLVAFAARYYQRSLGEVALTALPPNCATWQPAITGTPPCRPCTQGDTFNATHLIALTAEQESARAEIDAKRPFCCLAVPAAVRPRSICLRAGPATSPPPRRWCGARSTSRAAAGRTFYRFGAGGVSLHSGMTNPQRLKKLAGGAQRAGAHCAARAWRCLHHCRAWA